MCATRALKRYLAAISWGHCWVARLGGVSCTNHGWKYQNCYHVPHCRAATRVCSNLAELLGINTRSLSQVSLCQAPDDGSLLGPDLLQHLHEPVPWDICSVFISWHLFAGEPLTFCRWQVKRHAVERWNDLGKRNLCRNCACNSVGSSWIISQLVISRWSEVAWNCMS